MNLFCNVIYKVICKLKFNFDVNVNVAASGARTLGFLAGPWKILRATKRKNRHKLGFVEQQHEKMELGIKLCLMVEHLCDEMSNSIYMIQSLTNVADYEIDSDGLITDPIFPSRTIDNDYQLLKQCTMVSLRSRIYIFRGVINIDKQYFISDDVKHSVRFLDTQS